MRPRPDETAASLPGDELVPDADVIMDRGFWLEAPLEEVWPWLVQLGKQRAGWYLPRSVERFVPPPRRAFRHLDPRCSGLAVGDVVPDYGGARASFEVAELTAPCTLVYASRRGRTEVSWAIVASGPEPDATGDRTRVHLRLRLGPVRHRRLAVVVGGGFDALTVAGLAAGLRERLSEAPGPPGDGS
ncbi:MAG: hypothetical protein WB798_04350 [Nocardioidaceae bacterium]